MPTKITDNSFVSQYIRAIENPYSIGYFNGRWYQSQRKGDDPNNRGFGVDIKYNKSASKTAKGRPGKWLTEEEERNIRNSHLVYSEKILEDNTPSILAQPPSEAKKAMALGLLYRGDKLATLFDNPTLRDAYYGGTDKDFEKAVADYCNSKKLKERAKLHTSFIDHNLPTNNILINMLKDSAYPVHKKEEGGSLDTPKQWEDLSLSEKSDVMKAAVRNGVTSLADIRKTWDNFADSSYEGVTDGGENGGENGGERKKVPLMFEEPAEHKFLQGGYKPSDSIKRQITWWEGDSMKTNRSFGDEARDFWSAIPKNIRNNLSQGEADALFSYSYNVGAGNFKKRVVPHLQALYNGKGSVDDVTSSMKAKLDKDLRGLQRRRAVERGLFRDSFLRGHSEPVFLADMEDTPAPVFNTTPVVDPVNMALLPKMQKVEEPMFYEPTPMDNLNRMQETMAFLGMQNEASYLDPMTVYQPKKSSRKTIDLRPNVFADGGVTSSNGL